jgi:hypothetical protein
MISANGTRQMAFDFAMPWDRLLALRRRIDPNGMAGPFAQKLATVLLQVRQQFPPFHTAIEISSAAGSPFKAFSLSNTRSMRTA